MERFTQAIAGGQVEIAVDVPIDHIASADRLLLLLPVLMWIVAALLSWLVVRTFLLSPLRRISQSIAGYEPGQGPLQLPARLGPSVEIRELGASFTRAVERIEQSERDMGEALEGQRKLVREVHHRVKNNLQVVASLLNIHRRSAKSDDAQNAYSAIGRRVDALAVVHRNHFAELEENRGIALRPLISELASNLRGSAPKSARRLDINLDLESLNTTQDVAVATAFLTTEIVEHAMLTRPDAPGHADLTPLERPDRAIHTGDRRTVAGNRQSGRAPAIRTDHRGPRQAAAFGAGADRGSLQRRPAGLRPARDLLAGLRRPVLTTLSKNYVSGREPSPHHRRFTLRIVTFCPPALAIRLHGPEVVNPPPPVTISGPPCVWGNSTSAVTCVTAGSSRAVCVTRSRRQSVAARRANGSGGSR